MAVAWTCILVPEMEIVSWEEKDKYIKCKREIDAKLSGRTDCIQVLAEGLALVERNSYFILTVREK